MTAYLNHVKSAVRKTLTAAQRLELLRDIISQVYRTFPCLEAAFVDFWRDVIVRQTVLGLHAGSFILGHDLSTDVIQLTSRQLEGSVLIIFDCSGTVREQGWKR